MIKKLLKILFKEFKKIALFTHILISAITKDLKGQELVDFKENNAFDIVQGFSDDGKGVQSKE